MLAVPLLPPTMSTWLLSCVFDVWIIVAVPNRQPVGGIGPMVAIPKALERAGLELEQIDLIELNEAFASQVLACAEGLGIEEERLNVNGGAIALGHPLGCSGARLMTSLVWELRRRGGRYGIATLCVGVGQGVATVVEAL